MKITFICAEDEIPGICYLSSHLKNHGHQVSLVFDPKQFSRAYIRNDFLAKVFNRDQINLKKILKLKPDLIGFSCTTAHYQWALSFSKKIKKILPNTPIIFGGTHPTLVPELVISEKSIDFVCIGEGEEPLLELVNSINNKKINYQIKNIWAKKGSKIIRNQLRPLLDNLDLLPHMDKELFRDVLPKHYFTHTYFFTSRGCPYNCTFCGNEQMRKIYKGLGRYVRRMSPERSIEELLILKKKYQAKYILFEDDIFALDIKWLKKFIPLYKKKINLPFTCFGHTQILTEEIVKLLSGAGCDLLWFGIQSANEDIRKKVFQRYETNTQIIKATALCKKYKIKFMIDHLLNIPKDNQKAIHEAINLYNTIRPDIINCYNLLYFPKARINDLAIKDGLIKKKDINLINSGKSVVYQTGDYQKHERDFYSRYALILTIIPLLPPRIINRIIESKQWMNLFSQLPLFLIPIIKIILNLKSGRGFLPLAILKMELYFTIAFFKNKINQ